MLFNFHDGRGFSIKPVTFVMYGYNRNVIEGIPSLSITIRIHEDEYARSNEHIIFFPESIIFSEKVNR